RLEVKIAVGRRETIGVGAAQGDHQVMTPAVFIGDDLLHHGSLPRLESTVVHASPSSSKITFGQGGASRPSGPGGASIRRRAASSLIRRRSASARPTFGRGAPRASSPPFRS